MKKAMRFLRRLHTDTDGQMTVEWTLLLLAFGLPMMYIFRLGLLTLSEHFRMVTTVETLPFP